MFEARSIDFLIFLAALAIGISGCSGQSNSELISTGGGGGFSGGGEFPPPSPAEICRSAVGAKSGSWDYCLAVRFDSKVSKFCSDYCNKDCGSNGNKCTKCVSDNWSNFSFNPTEVKACGTGSNFSDTGNPICCFPATETCVVVNSGKYNPNPCNYGDGDWQACCNPK